MGDRLRLLTPEVILFAGAVVAAILGLSRLKAWRDAVPVAAVIALVGAMIAVVMVHTPERAAAADLLMPMLGRYVKLVVYGVGITLVMLSSGLIDRRLEAAFSSGRAAFDAIRVNRGEYYAFLLLSLMGLSLISNANDLIWLFLALELTSLPTYIMVAISRSSRLAQESAVKYFFLGAMAAAIFLFGFALLYGATGTIVLTEMQHVFALQASEGGLSATAIFGIVLSVVGIGFKIAAVPMHFYAADVYEGAAAAVTAFLAFVPKAAGMISIILLLTTVGWSGHTVMVADFTGRLVPAPVTGLPSQITTVLWMIAVLTMTLGNIGALLQKSIKRMFAYSSIAHSGYMLIGVIAGPGTGINAVLFYLLAYGVMNTAAFAVLAGLERRGEEIETLDDLAGLRQRHPWMAAVMAIAAGSLIGLPPLLGFWGKLYIFAAGIEAGHLPLVIIAGVNSAISAWYYLKLVGLPILGSPSAQGDAIVNSPSPWPRIAGVVAAVAVVALPIGVGPLFDVVEESTEPLGTPAARDHGLPSAAVAKVSD
jgi:NADH-quinone oxidoreductase subunit N